MQRAVKYLLDYYNFDNITELYSFFKEEIQSSPNKYYPNPLRQVTCVHIVNDEYTDQPVAVEGTLDLVAGEELFTTCYPKKPAEGIDWSQPLYVELKDLMICPGDLPKCQCRYEQPAEEEEYPEWMNNLDEMMMNQYM